MIGGLGASSALGITGTAASLYGGMRAGKARRKAAKAANAAIMEGLKQYKQGSTDAMGNTLSADKSGRWSYDLGVGGQQAANAANRANIQAGTTAPVSRTQQMRNNLAGMNQAANVQAQANQAAALKNAARSGSNLGLISNNYAQQGSKNLQNMHQNAINNAKNSAAFNANLTNQLAQAANSAQQPIQGIQGNLQGMVSNLNRPFMGQYNSYAKGTSNPYAHGMAQADMWKGIGGVLSGMGQGMQQQMNFDKILSVLSNMGGGTAGSSGSIDPSTFLSLIQLFSGGMGA